MATLLTIVQIERAISCCAADDPPKDNVLGRDLSLMAEVYGRMVYERAESVDLDGIPPEIAGLYRKWAQH